MKRWQIVISVIAALLVSGFLFAWKEYNRKPADTKNRKPVAVKEAMSLLKEFETDETGANLKYSGKVITVKGTVLKMEKTEDMHHLILGDESSPAGVVCELQAEYKDDANKIIPGQQVSVKGICTGILLDVVLVRCVLDKIVADNGVMQFDFSLIGFNY